MIASKSRVFPQSLAGRFGALAVLREEGTIRHLGLSNIDADHLAEARTIAPVVAVQNHFHIARRGSLALLGACEAGNIAFSRSSPPPSAAPRPARRGPITLIAEHTRCPTPPSPPMTWPTTPSDPGTSRTLGPGRLPTLRAPPGPRRADRRPLLSADPACPSGT